MSTAPVSYTHLDLARHDQREGVEKTLWILHDAHDLTRDAAHLPGLAKRKMEGRFHAARDGDLIGARGVATAEEREHRGAERTRGDL